ncbi:MAG: NAD(P)H-binding protein [Gammaproteobacteria bacterium]|jgi:uncharacterized protein YbjT (DUF2867 family)
MHNLDQKFTLVTGGTGKTGRRIVENLKTMGKPVRVGSRSSSPSFDWNNESRWDECLENVEAVYISYAPDLAMPGATDTIKAFVDLAVAKGVKRLVLLSGRGEEEAQACEQIVINSGLEWTIVRASWFFQNFSEGAFIDMVLGGQIALPAGDTQEPFVDVDDISEVATAALSQDRHNGQIYELTGPRLMRFTDIAADLSAAIGREITYLDVPHDAFVNEVKASGAPQDVVWMLDYLFATVLDGRNSSLTDGVKRALGREPRDFRLFAREVAKTGLWRVAA